MRGRHIIEQKHNKNQDSPSLQSCLNWSAPGKDWIFNPLTAHQENNLQHKKKKEEKKNLTVAALRRSISRTMASSKRRNLAPRSLSLRSIPPLSSPWMRRDFSSSSTSENLRSSVSSPTPSAPSSPPAIAFTAARSRRRRGFPYSTPYAEERRGERNTRSRNACSAAAEASRPDGLVRVPVRSTPTIPVYLVFLKKSFFVKKFGRRGECLRRENFFYF